MYENIYYNIIICETIRYYNIIIDRGREPFTGLSTRREPAI